MTWIDAHCHLADPRLEPTLDAVLARSRAAGVTAWVQGGVEPNDWDRQTALRDKYGPGIVRAFGIHPWWIAAPERTTVQLEGALLTLSGAAEDAEAIGETGLDLHPAHARPESVPEQLALFEDHITLARQLRKPLVLHIVKAHPQALSLLRRHGPYAAGGIVHSFSGSGEIAREYLDLGFHLSVGGAVTQEGFQTLKKAVTHVPSDRLLVETDAPDQTPRLVGLAEGSLNEPANLKGIAAVVAGLRHTTPEAVLDASAENLRRLFRLE